jgi:hypothetical protein
VFSPNHPTVRAIKAKAERRATKAAKDRATHNALISAILLVDCTEQEREWFARGAHERTEATLRRSPWLRYPARAPMADAPIGRMVESRIGPLATILIRLGRILGASRGLA